MRDNVAHKVIPLMQIKIQLSVRIKELLELTRDEYLCPGQGQVVRVSVHQVVMLGVQFFHDIVQTTRVRLNAVWWTIHRRFVLR